MEGDTPDFNVFHFNFSDDSLSEWEKVLGLSDTVLISCAFEAQVFMFSTKGISSIYMAFQDHSHLLCLRVFL